MAEDKYPLSIEKGEHPDSYRIEGVLYSGCFFRRYAKEPDPNELFYFERDDCGLIRVRHLTLEDVREWLADRTSHNGIKQNSMMNSSARGDDADHDELYEARFGALRPRRDDGVINDPPRGEAHNRH